MVWQALGWDFPRTQKVLFIPRALNTGFGARLVTHSLETSFPKGWLSSKISQPGLQCQLKWSVGHVSKRVFRILPVFFLGVSNFAWGSPGLLPALQWVFFAHLFPHRNNKEWQLVTGNNTSWHGGVYSVSERGHRQGHAPLHTHILLLVVHLSPRDLR